MHCPVDLHIHSCLSPCADADMTPHNIVQMAALKGLKAVAVCDHNSARNLPAAMHAGEQHGVLVLPALEVQTREEVHVLAYFTQLKAALDFGDWVYSILPPIINHPTIFGHQLIMDENDQILGEEPHLLSQSLPVSIDILVEQINIRGGFAVPAHINRGAHSLLTLLGFIPNDIAFAAMEIAPLAPPPACSLTQWDVLTASDAHDLGAISEPDFSVNIESVNLNGFQQLFTQWQRKHIR